MPVPTDPALAGLIDQWQTAQGGWGGGGTGPAPDTSGLAAQINQQMAQGGGGGAPAPAPAPVPAGGGGGNNPYNVDASLWGRMSPSDMAIFNRTMAGQGGAAPAPAPAPQRDAIAQAMMAQQAPQAPPQFSGGGGMGGMGGMSAGDWAIFSRAVGPEAAQQWANSRPWATPTAAGGDGPDPMAFSFASGSPTDGPHRWNPYWAWVNQNGYGGPGAGGGIAGTTGQSGDTGLGSGNSGAAGMGDAGPGVGNW